MFVFKISLHILTYIHIINSIELTPTLFSIEYIIKKSNIVLEVFAWTRTVLQLR